MASDFKSVSCLVNALGNHLPRVYICFERQLILDRVSLYDIIIMFSRVRSWQNTRLSLVMRTCKHLFLGAYKLCFSACHCRYSCLAIVSVGKQRGAVGTDIAKYRGVYWLFAYFESPSHEDMRKTFVSRELRTSVDGLNICRNAVGHDNVGG